MVLVRHGETEWSLAGRHTGRTDLPLTERGRQVARALERRLSAYRFDLVLTSPLTRARQTVALAGLEAAAQPDPDLMEWDYGRYEGRTSAEIRDAAPGWSLFVDGVPGGERLDAVAARADRVIARVRAHGGTVALFSHGHLLRVLAARWLGLAPGLAGQLALGTAAVSVLSQEGELGKLQLWNDQSHLG